MGFPGHERARGPSRRRTSTALALVALVGCVRATGALPRVAQESPRDGYKLLRPHARVERCAGSWFGEFGAPDTDELGPLLRALLALDDEATTVRNARIEWTGWSVGVYARRCVAMEGDVVRSASTVVLPMPGDHAGH